MDKELSVEEVRALIEKDKREREQKCSQEIEEVLKKYNCVLDIQLIISLQGYKFNVNVIAKE